jgi:adenylate cyclase
MTATRRLAAILAADVADYSRLIGADEGGTLQALKAIRAELIDPTIATHNGRLVKTTGDGLLVEFGSVVDALSCATEVQAGMAERNATAPPDKRVEYRIGINVGDIVIEDGDIFGDGVNVAARLEALAEPGGICVSARVQEDAVGKLDLAFEDIGEQALKNIARPVRAYRIATSAMSPTVQGRPTLALPDKPSVAVLPFTNMSADPEQEFFADGIAEDIITALSRYPSLFVIARNSSFTYKGRAVDVKEIGRELGVRYVLEGSLRKWGGRIRVTAQLVEAETGNRVWVERYDRDLADIFAVQDEIAEAVTIAVAPAIAETERQRAIRKPPGSLDAWAAYQRGLWHFCKMSAADNALAHEFFQQAIDSGPTFSGGYKGVAMALLQGTTAFQTRRPPEVQSMSEELARTAVALDAADAEARSCLGWSLWRRGDSEGALVEVERALAMAPNLALAHRVRGSVLMCSGRPKDGLRSLERSIRLDPYGPNSAVGLHQVALCFYFSGEYEAAVQSARRAIRSYPEDPMPPRWLAAALGQLGRTEEAKEALGKAISMAPAFFEKYAHDRLPWVRPEDPRPYSRRLAQGRLAGGVSNAVSLATLTNQNSMPDGTAVPGTERPSTALICASWRRARAMKRRLLNDSFMKSYFRTLSFSGRITAARLRNSLES